jgi:hypothetical protein
MQFARKNIRSDQMKANIKFKKHSKLMIEIWSKEMYGVLTIFFSCQPCRILLIGERYQVSRKRKIGWDDVEIGATALAFGRKAT